MMNLNSDSLVEMLVTSIQLLVACYVHVSVIDSIPSLAEPLCQTTRPTLSAGKVISTSLDSDDQSEFYQEPRSLTENQSPPS